MKKVETIHRVIFWIFIVAMSTLAIYSLARSEWASAFVITQAIIITCIPFVLEKKFSIHTPYLLRIGFVLFLFCTMILGEISDLYNAIWWWDALWHMISSSGITIIGFILLTIIYRSRDLKNSPLLTSFLAFSFAMSVAVLWEIYEFTIDVFFETNTPMQPSNTDTMTDLIVAVIGSLAICFYGYAYINGRSKKTIINKTIEEGRVENQIEVATQ